MHQADAYKCFADAANDYEVQVHSLRPDLLQAMDKSDLTHPL